MAILPPVVVELQAVITQFQAKMAEAKGELDAMQTHGESFGRSFAAAGTTAFLAVGAAAVAVGVAAIELADKFETSHARLTAALTANGRSFDEWKSRIDDADKAGEKLGFTNAQVEDGLARLETMVRDPATAIRDLAVAEDVARARGIDLTTASNLVGKAQEGTYTAMVRLGIVTKEQAAAFTSGAQAVDFLAQRFGGQAQAYTDTFAGKMEVLKAEVEDTGKNLGLILIPAVETVAGAFADATNWVMAHREGISQVARIVVEVLVPAFALWLVAQAQVIAAGFLAFVESAANLLATFAVGIYNTATALYVMGTAADVALGPFGILAAAVTGAIAVFTNFGKSADEASQASKNYVTQVEQGVPAATDKLTTLEKVQQELFDQASKMSVATTEDANARANLLDKVRALQPEIDKLKKAQQEQQQATHDVTDATGDSAQADQEAAQRKKDLEAAQKDATNAIKDATTYIKDYFSATTDAVRGDIDWADKKQRLIDATKGQTTAADTSTAATDAARVAADKVTLAEHNLADVEQKVKDGRLVYQGATDALTKAHDALTNAQDASAKAQQRVTGATSAGTTSLDLNTEAGRKNMGIINDLVTSTDNLIQKELGSGDTADQQRSKIQGYIDKLNGVFAAAGFSAAQIQNLDDQYKLTPTAIDTTVNVHTDSAMAQLFILDGALNTTLGRMELAGMTAFQFTGLLPTGRQGGGPVEAGRPYLVGEHGVELFMPGVAGQVVSNPATMAMARGGGAGVAGGINVTVNVAGSVVSERQLVDAVRTQLARDQRARTGLFA